jgi:transcriptional regulator with XRE-family HTH domain
MLADVSSPSPVGAVAENLRRLRAEAGRSLGDIARAAGVSKSTLSALESGNGNPGIETLWAVAVALGVPFGQLVAEAPAAVRVIRAGEGARLDSESDASFGVRLLASTTQKSARDIYVLEAEPGHTRTAAAHMPGTVEHAICTAGRMRLGPTGREVDIARGDCAVFPGDVPHSYRALAKGTRLVLVLEYA